MINILCPPQQLKLGRKGENEFRTIEFDVAPWLADYPNGSISVVYMRPDGVVYPPEVSTANGVTSWVITSIDTAAAGAGYAEIRLVDGDVVGKSARINTMVYLAVNGTEIAPPAPDWTVVAAQIMAMMGNLDDLTTEAKSNLVAAINEAAESGGGGTGDHRDLTHRDAADQHPMSAITGLVAALAAKGTYSKPSGGIPASDLAAGVIPTVNDAVLTIKQGGTVKGTFSANAASATEINLDAGGGAAVWGGISGTLANQTDLKNALDGKLSTTGGTMTGDIDMGFNRLRFDNTIAWLQIADDEDAIEVLDSAGYFNLRVAEPTYDNDAVNKKYVDDNYAEKDDLNDYQQTALTATVTIAVADWEGSTTVTKNVTGVTATNIVFCDSSDADVQCTAQGAGTLTFTASTTPTAEVTVKVVILP